MAERLKIDIDALNELAVSLKVAFDKLDKQYYFTREVEGVVGHGDVIGAVSGFENKWNRNRTNIVNFVSDLNTALVTVADAFGQLETDLTNGLTPSASAPINDNSARAAV